ncbi:36845_t:CDS:1, partial [Gigaspora margarita]
KRMDKIIEQLLFQNAKDQQVAPRSLMPYSVVPMEIYASDIEFGDSLSSIQNGLNNWKARNVVLLNLECNIEYVKWKHFLNLNLAYRALKRVVNQMPPEGNKTTIKYKIQNKIPIGKNSSKKSKRSWISYQMQTMLHIDKRAERRIWTALRFINFLLLDGIITESSLFNSKIAPDFFKKMNGDDHIYFLKKIKKDESLTFNINDVKSDEEEHSEEEYDTVDEGDSH